MGKQNAYKDEVTEVWSSESVAALLTELGYTFAREDAYLHYWANGSQVLVDSPIFNVLAERGCSDRHMIWTAIDKLASQNNTPDKWLTMLQANVATMTDTEILQVAQHALVAADAYWTL